MIISEQVPDFGFSTELNEAHEIFGEDLGVIAYVEGYEDVRFWTKEFNKLNLEITAQEISAIDTANGKDTILSAIKKGRISLGRKLLICIDSDYDYLLDNNTDIYSSPFCFQTYTYAIENYYYNPIGLTELCCEAAGVYQGINKNHLELLLIEWSKYIYGFFLHYLSENAPKSSSQLQKIQLSLNELGINPKSYQNITSHNLPDEKLEILSNKGLSSDNVFLYFRGHDLESKMKALAEAFVNQLSNQKKATIESSQANDTSTLIKEYFNHRKEVETLATTRHEYPINHCYNRLQADIQEYKTNYI